MKHWVHWERISICLGLGMDVEKDMADRDQRKRRGRQGPECGEEETSKF